MKYEVVITRPTEMLWRAMTPVLPGYIAEAATRNDALAKLQEDLARVNYLEVIEIEAPSSLKAEANGSNPSDYTTFEQEWPDYGIFRDDPHLNELFDEIERRRDEQPGGIRKYLGAFRNDPTWGPMFDDIEWRRDEQLDAIVKGGCEI